MEGDVSDTKPSVSGIDVISAVLDQVNKLRSELNYVKAQHITDMETMSKKHQTDIETVSHQHQTDMETMSQKHQTDIEAINQERKS